MKVGKIGALGANEVERIASLGDWIVGTDAYARVLFALGETVQQIPVADVSEFTMSMNSPTWQDTMCVTHTPNLPWELVLTTYRLILWLPLVTGMFGTMKQKPGKATGCVIRYEEVDRIVREDALTLTLAMDFGTQALAFALEFPTAQAASDFSSSLAELIPAFWMHEVETAKRVLDSGILDSGAPGSALGQFFPHLPSGCFAQLGRHKEGLLGAGEGKRVKRHLTMVATMDINNITAEIGRLRNIDWSSPYAGSFEEARAISLRRAGVPAPCNWLWMGSCQCGRTEYKPLWD